MIQPKNRNFPTEFAIQIAICCDLFVPPNEERGNEELWLELRDRLANFQKMAITTDFDTSMVAYFGMDIDMTQVKYLRYIHKNTKDWIRGHLAETLINQLESGTLNGNSAPEIVRTLIEKFLDGDKEIEKKKGGILVQLSPSYNSANQEKKDEPVA